MELKTSQYQTLMRAYERRRLLSHDIYIQRYNEVCQASPKFKALEESIAEISLEHGRQLLNGNINAVAELKHELNQLREQKKLCMLESGFPENYLEPVYTCKDCNDTGYIGQNKCHCFKQAMIELLYEQSNLNNIFQRENFDTFSFKYYSDNYIDERTNRSALTIIKEAYNISKDFIHNFSTAHENLFFYGNVGVGKTFLSNCIAKELINSGFSVIYYSAPAFFSMQAKAAFDKNDVDAKNMNEYIYDCDLLIIDDLGTEYINSFITSKFFSCINDRILNQKSTIISTNLSLDTLVDLYSERTFSRITSNYTMLRLVGDDIRIKKRFLSKEETR